MDDYASLVLQELDALKAERDTLKAERDDWKEAAFGFKALRAVVRDVAQQIRYSVKYQSVEKRVEVWADTLAAALKEGDERQ